MIVYPPSPPGTDGRDGTGRTDGTNYAHIKVVVAFLVVNFFGFLVIARNPANEF